MSQLQHSGALDTIENCAFNHTRCEVQYNPENQNERENRVYSVLPTAEDCAKYLSSMFAPGSNRSVANNETTRLSRNDEADDPGKRHRVMEKLVRFAVPVTTNAKSRASDIHVLGCGTEQFEIKVCIERCRDVRRLRASTNAGTSSDDNPIRNLWLSYRFIGTIVQSDTLSDGNSISMMNTFRIQCSLPELVRYFNDGKNATLKIHLCTEGEVLGTSFVDLRRLIAPDYVSEGRVVQNEYIIKQRGSEASNVEDDKGDSHPCPPRIVVRLCIDRSSAIDAVDDSEPCPARLRATAAVSSSTSSQTVAIECDDKDTSPGIKGTAEKDLSELSKEQQSSGVKEAELSMRERELYQATASLERKRCEWEQWRYRQEVEWQEKLRLKEDAMLKVVEERARIIERERLSSLELSQNEYEKLEARLRKVLIDVEAKERQLKDIELGYQHERKRRLAELESREKLMKEELKHSIAIEQAKTNAAIEQAIVAGKSMAAANKKLDQMVSEMDRLREQHRATPEYTLLHKLAELTGQLAESERRIEILKAEKNQVNSEKEQFRSNVHKLAKALRQERKKAATKREFNNQQARLSYDTNEKSFVLGGGQAEVQQILTDLYKISQLKGRLMVTKGDSYDNQDGSTSHDNNIHPTPSAQPLRPCFGYSYGMQPQIASDVVDLSGMLASPG